MPDGTVIQPTGKSFDVVFSTAARWRDGKIVEEYLLYDSGTSSGRSASPEATLADASQTGTPKRPSVPAEATVEP